MSLILYCALVPLYADPDGPMYPPVTVADRFLFGCPARSITRARLDDADALQSLVNKLDRDTLASLHLLVPVNIDTVKMYSNQLYEIYDNLDTLALWSQQIHNADMRSVIIGTLTRLRRNLGPINYYRGIVPPIPTIE